MATSNFRNIQLFSDQFVVSAGSVLFQRNGNGKFNMCILHNPENGEYWLPKGRKDRGETIQDAAARETYEETGYKCKLLPVKLLTRAAIPGVDHKDFPQLESQSTEPIAVTIRQISPTNVRVVWWFITMMEDAATKEIDTQMPSESFEAVVLEAEEASTKLTFKGDEDIATKALDLLLDTSSATSLSSS